MIQKICILFLIAFCIQNGKCSEDDGPGFFSRVSDIPFEMIDARLSAANNAFYNAFKFASEFFEAVSKKMGDVTGKVLDYASEIAKTNFDGMRGIVKVLKNAKDGIGETLSDIHSDLSAARDNFLEKFQNYRETVLKVAVKNGHEFLKNCTEAAKYQLDNALESGKVALKKASELAEEFVKEAKVKADAAKVEILEKISEELKKLREEYDDLKDKISEKLKNLIEDLKNFKNNEKFEDYRKFFDEHIAHIKSVVSDASELASKVKSRIGELIEAGKEYHENLSADLKAKASDITDHLKEFAGKAAAFRDEVLASAKQSIESIVEQSKGTFAAYYDSVAEHFKKGIDHLNGLYKATLSLVGDFFREKEPQVTQTRASTEEALADVNEHKWSFLGGLQKIVEAFTEKIASYSEESESSDVDFAGDSLEDSSKSFNDLWEKIQGIAKTGKEVVENLFHKGQDLYKESKEHISSAVSNDIEYLKEKYKETKKYLNELANNLNAQFQEAKKQIKSYLSEIYNKVSEKISQIYSEIAEQVKQGAAGAKEVYYKVAKKVQALKDQASEALEDFNAQATVQVANAIESVKLQADEIQKYVESRFIQGSKKGIECLKQHKDNVPELLSEVTKELSECGSEGFKSAASSIKESFDTEDLSGKIAKLSKMYNECKENSGYFGSFSCLRKLPVDETLGLSKAASGISAGVQDAAKNVGACTSGSLAKAGNSFNDFRAKMDQCMAA